MIWYDGGKKPDADLFDGETVSDTGVLLIGDKGKLFAPGDYCEKGFKLLGGRRTRKSSSKQSPGHFDEFARAIKGGAAGTLELRRLRRPADRDDPAGQPGRVGRHEPGGPGKKIEWDAKNLKPTNAPEVESVVKPTYTEGYTL